MTALTHPPTSVPRVAAPELATLREYFASIEANLPKAHGAPKKTPSASVSPKLLPTINALARRHAFSLIPHSEPAYLTLRQGGQPPLVIHRMSGSSVRVTQTFILASHLAIELSIIYARRRRQVHRGKMLVYDARLSRASLSLLSNDRTRKMGSAPLDLALSGGEVSPFWFLLDTPEANEVFCASWARMLREQKWTHRRVPQECVVSPVYANWPEYDAWIGASVRRERGAGNRVELVRLPVPGTDTTWHHLAP